MLTAKRALLALVVVLLAVVPSQAAITFVVHVAGAGAGTFTTGAVSASGGDFIAVSLSEATNGCVALSDNVGGNTYTGLTEQSNSVAPSKVLYYVQNANVSGSMTWTATGSCFAVIDVIVFTGVHKTAAFDSQENGTGGGAFTNVAQPGAITPANNDSLVVTGFGWGSAMTITSVTGTTAFYQTDFSGGNNYGGGGGYVIQSGAPSSYNPAWNFTGTIAGNVVVASFKPAAGGATCAPTLTLLGVGRCG